MLEQENKELVAQSADASGEVVNQLETKTDLVDRKETVSYETHKNLLGQRKRDQERLRSVEAKLSEYETEAKAANEQRLKDDNNLKELLKLRDQENALVKTELADTKRVLEDGAKMVALQTALGVKIDDQYLSLIDTNEIAVDPETKLPDPASVSEYARKFREVYGLVLSPASGGKIPNDAPKHAGPVLSTEEWQKLPAGKEKRDSMKEVFQRHIK